MTKIIKNKTEGYGYNYASLVDIAEQDIDIPKMKTGTDQTSLKDYIYWYDEELKEWLRGCEIVVSDNKSMNKSQCYLSAITYAKRGTTLMARCIATQDDEEVENTNKDGTSKVQKKASVKQIEYLQKLYSQENLKAIMEHYKVNDLKELTCDVVSKYIDDANKKKAERWEGLDERPNNNN